MGDLFEILPLTDDSSFGARIKGVNHTRICHEDVRQALRAAFEEHGLLIFEDVEQTARMQVAISEVFGALKSFPMPSVKHVDDERMPGVIDMTYSPDAPGARMGLVEVGGKILHSWLPWHFDHCYNDKLNRAGVLRSSINPPEGGLTHFSDGIELYGLLDPNLREAIEDREVYYSLRGVPLETIRFGKPDLRLYFREENGHGAILRQAENTPRAIHPAVWQRDDGREVLHLCGYFACGIVGDASYAGNALLDAVCHEVNRLSDAHNYAHRWTGTEMLIWDNWRMLHHAGGAAREHKRSMQRTTILGDYGLGRFEGDREGHEVLEKVTV